MYSYWEQQSFLHSDILIIGGGVLGLATACSIKEHHPNVSVTVLERGIFPTGASTRNAGFACFGSLTELLADERTHGADTMLTLVEKRWRGLAFLDQRFGEEAMDYQHHGGFELLNEKALDAHQHLERINSMLFQIFNMEVFHSTPTKVAEFGFNPNVVKDIIFNPFEGQLNTGKVMRAFIKYANSIGVLLINGADVKHIDSDSNGVTAEVTSSLHASTATFRATHMVVCTNGFLSQLIPEIGVTPGRGQVLLTKPIKDLKIEGVYHFDEGYYYFRNIENRVLFGGGRNIDAEGEASTELKENTKITQHLRNLLNTIILPQQEYEIESTWQGIMGFRSERLPTITEPKKNIIAAFACNGMGVAISSVIGEEIAERISL